MAVNAYVEPHITLDFDLVIAALDLPAVERSPAASFDIARLLEAHPELRPSVPPEILAKLPI